MSHLILVQSVMDQMIHYSRKFMTMIERTKPGYLKARFPQIPEQYFPAFGTKAYWLLVLLSDGERHSIWELWAWLASPAGPRSALQALSRENSAHWLLHHSSEGGLSYYQLDELHTSGEQLDDALARIDSELRFLNRSESFNARSAQKLPRVIEKKRRFLSQRRPASKPGKLPDL